MWTRASWVWSEQVRGGQTNECVAGLAQGGKRRPPVTVANTTASTTSVRPMTAPASPPGGLAGAVTRGDQEAVGLIAIVSFFAFSGSGIVTSTTPSCVSAVIFVASTPAGSAIERRKDPYRRSRRT
jgi:hypothetical protein